MKDYIDVEAKGMFTPQEEGDCKLTILIPKEDKDAQNYAFTTLRYHPVRISLVPTNEPKDTTAVPPRLDTLQRMQEYLSAEIAAEMAKSEPPKIEIVPLDTLPLEMEPERCCDTCKNDGEECCQLVALDIICENYDKWEPK